MTFMLILLFVSNFVLYLVCRYLMNKQTRIFKASQDVMAKYIARKPLKKYEVLEEIYQQLEKGDFDEKIVREIVFEKENMYYQKIFSSKTKKEFIQAMADFLDYKSQKYGRLNLTNKKLINERIHDKMNRIKNLVNDEDHLNLLKEKIDVIGYTVMADFFDHLEKFRTPLTKTNVDMMFREGIENIMNDMDKREQHISLGVTYLQEFLNQRR